MILEPENDFNVKFGIMTIIRKNTLKWPRSEGVGEYLCFKF